MQYKNKLYIDGKWLAGDGGVTFDVINPASEEVITKVASAEIEDAKKAINAAETAFESWAKVSPRDKSVILRKAYELFMNQIEHFAELITLENGKAYVDAKGEALYSAEFFRWYSEEAVRGVGQISHAPATGARIVVQYKPIGISVLVTPWNYPAAMGTRKIAPAIAAGCPVIIKPASETPLTMLELMPLLEEAGVPKGLISVLPSRNTSKLVDHLLHDSRVRLVSFTGSTEVGRKLLKVASDQVLKTSMELGGNAPLIVFDDADMETAVDGCMVAKMRNLGEACTAANRIYVHESVAEEFKVKISKRMGSLKVGNGLDKSVDVGPLVNAETRDKVAYFVKDAIEKGAELTVGGVDIDGPGYYYPPTVLYNVHDSSECLNDEIFGPVAVIQTFKDTDEVITRANNTEYGLVAYVFTEDMKKGMQVCERLDYGMVGLNRGLVSDPAAPFGGTKQSGLGREGGHEGMLEFMEAQYISSIW